MLRKSYVILALVLLSGCFGDLEFDENQPTAPGAPPPGSTTSLGSTSAIVDNESFNAPLQTPAVWRNDNFGFTGINSTGITKILGVSLRLPGPGTYNTGGFYSPVISYLELQGSTTYRWFMNSQRGSGSVTVSFLSNESASGYFNGELVPDSATVAAGFVSSKFVSGGTFNVSVIR
jgi:hypothetical protein